MVVYLINSKTRIREIIVGLISKDLLMFQKCSNYFYNLMFLTYGSLQLEKIFKI